MSRVTALLFTTWALLGIGGAAWPQDLPLERESDLTLRDFAGYSSANGYDNGFYVHVGDTSDPDGFHIDRRREARMTFDYGGFEAFDGLLFVQQVATVHIYDLATDRMRPKRVGVFDTKLRLRSAATPEMLKFIGGSAMQFARRGDVLFVSGEHYLIAVDISTPSAPVEISRIEVFDRLNPIGSVTLDGDMLIAGRRSEIQTLEELAVLDVSDPAAMTVMARHAAQNPIALHLQGNVLYVMLDYTLNTYTVDGTGGLVLQDSVPVWRENGWETVDDPLGSEYYNRYPPGGRIVVKDGRLFALVRQGLVGVYFEFDLSDPLAPVVLPNDARDYHNVLHDLDASPPETYASGYDMTVASDRVYTTEMAMQSWSTNPAVPDVIKHEWAYTSAGMLLTSDGPYVYGVSIWYFTENPTAPGSPWGGLWLHDSRNPTGPIQTLPVHFFDTVEGTHLDVPGGVTNGQSLIVTDWRSLLRLDFTQEGLLEPVGRTNRATTFVERSPSRNEPTVTDVTGDTVYTFVDDPDPRANGLRLRAFHTYAMGDVKTVTAEAPVELGTVLGVEAVGSLLFTSRWKHVREISAYYTAHRLYPALLDRLRLPLSNLETDRTPAGNDDRYDTLIYRDGYVYWLTPPASVNVVDATQPSVLSHSRTIDAYEHSGTVHTLQNSSTARAIMGMEQSRDRLFLYRWTASTSTYFIEEYDISVPGQPVYVRSQPLPGTSATTGRSVVPLGDRLYVMSGLDSPLDAMNVYTGTGAPLAGGLDQGDRPVYVSQPCQIPFGSTGLMMRYGITWYEMPDAVTPILVPERTYIRVGRNGGRVEVPIHNGADGPMKWYVHDDGGTRDWTALWGRDQGEEDESVFVTVDRNWQNKLRISQVMVYAPGAVNSPGIIQIVQGPLPGVAMTCNPSAVEIGAEEWTVPVTVDTTTGAAVAWTASTEAAWITVDGGSAGNGRTETTITIAPNPMLAYRETTVVFASEELAFGTDAVLSIKQTGRVTGGFVGAVDVQKVINAVLQGKRDSSLDVNSDGTLNSADVQMTVNAALGLYR